VLKLTTKRCGATQHLFHASQVTVCYLWTFRQHDHNRWDRLQAGDSVLLDEGEVLSTHKRLHDLDWDILFGRDEDGVCLAVSMVQREEAAPSLAGVVAVY
jgi:hypothetical protein